MTSLKTLLSGGDLRSIGNADDIVSMINSQEDFDCLFKLVFDEERIVAMRAADAVEKITRVNPLYISKHKQELLVLGYKINNKELKWHIAQLLPRLCLNAGEAANVWQLLFSWAADKTNSNIVRVNAIQGLFDLLKILPCNNLGFQLLLNRLKKEEIPSINARIKHFSV